MTLRLVGSLRICCLRQQVFEVILMRRFQRNPCCRGSAPVLKYLDRGIKGRKLRTSVEPMLLSLHTFPYLTVPYLTS